MIDRSHGYGHGNSLAINKSLSSSFYVTNPRCFVLQVLLRQPQQNQGGAISQALNGLGLDYETFALGLALAGLVGAYSIYTVIGFCNIQSVGKWNELQVDFFLSS